jgi:hypothetical protein
MGISLQKKTRSMKRIDIALSKTNMAIGTYDRGGNGAPIGLVLNTSGGYQLDFRCLNSDDPGLARPYSYASSKHCYSRSASITPTRSDVALKPQEKCWMYVGRFISSLADVEAAVDNIFDIMYNLDAGASLEFRCNSVTPAAPRKHP